MHYAVGGTRLRHSINHGSSSYAVHKAKRGGELYYWADNRRSYNTFKKDTRKVKRVSWERFCGYLENTADTT